MSISTRWLLSIGLLIVMCGCGDDAPAPEDNGIAVAHGAGNAAPATSAAEESPEPDSSTPERISPGLLAREFTWKKGEPPVTMIHRDDGFAFLTGVEGAVYPHVEVGAVMEADGNWVLKGATDQPQIMGRAVAVPWFVEIERPVEFKTWRAGTANLTELVDQRDGFCVLLLVGGHLRGATEQFRLRVIDGSWRLNARSQTRRTHVRVMVVRVKEPGSFHGIVREHEWRTNDGQGPIRLIHSADGFAFLSGLSGSFVPGEFARVTLGEDGYWYLEGRSHDGEAHAWATSIQLTGPDTPLLAATEGTTDSVTTPAAEQNTSPSTPASNEQTVLPDSWNAHASPVHTVDVSADGRWAVTGAKDGAVRVWDLDDASLVADLRGVAAAIADARISAGGRWVAASVPGRKELRVWSRDPLRPGSAQEFHTFSNNDEGFLQVSLSDDGRAIVTGGSYQVRLYDTLDRKLLHSLETSAYGSAVSPDGQFAAFGGWNKYIDLYEAGSWTRTARLEGHADHVYALAFSGDGRRLASGDGAQVLRVWDIQSGDSLAELRGNQAGIQRVALSRDGRRVASWDGNTARVWNVDEGKRVLEVSGSFRPALSPDGNLLLTGHADGTVHAHRLPALAPAPPSPSGIHGEWEIVEATDDGSPDDDLVGDVYAFSEDGKKLAIHFDGDRSSFSTFRLDCTIDTSQEHVDYALGGDTMLGIYRIEDGRLTICFDVNERPADFTSSADNENRLLVLKRVGAPDPVPADTPRPAVAATSMTPAEARSALEESGFEFTDDDGLKAMFASGELANDDLAPFQYLPEITGIALIETPVTDAGLNHLKGLENLKALFFESTAITDEGLRLIGQMAHLEELAIRFNVDVTAAGLNHLRPLTRLTVLSIDGVDIGPGQMQFAREMTELTLFTFYSSQGLADSDLQVLGSMTKLTELSLIGLPWVNDNTISRLNNLKELEALDLSSTQVSDRALQTVAAFPRLQALVLVDTGVGDEGMEHLSQLTELHSIDLSYTEVTARGLAALRNCPLTDLTLRGPSVTDRHLAPLRQWKDLTALDLRGDVDYAPDEDQAIPTQITLRGILTLSECDQLEVLLLSLNPQITDAAVPHLSKLKNLVVLDLTDTGVTGAGGRRIADAIDGLEFEGLGIVE